MATRELSTYEKIERELFKSAAEIQLNEREKEIRKRVMLCVSKKMENPLTTNSELVKFLMGGGEGLFIPVSQAQAYNDIAGINKIVGNIQLAGKSWYRYMIIEGAKKAYAIAEGKDDAAGMAAALDKIGKYTRSDKEDDEFDWSQMIPPAMEPTDDVSVLEGFEPIDNLEEERRNFRALFKRQLNQKAEEVEPQTEGAQ